MRTAATRFTAALPANMAGGAFGLGVMDFDGDQWAFANWTDGQPRARAIRSAASGPTPPLYSFNNALTVQKKRPWVSMNADGFTLNFTNAGSNAAARVFSLALKGVNVKPGSFLKSTGAAPAAQPITGVGFRPSLVMLASVQSTTQATPVAHSRFGLGASDGSTEGSSAFQDQNAAGFDDRRRHRQDQQSLHEGRQRHAGDRCRGRSRRASHADGFTLNWTTNDAVQTEILYLALAPMAVTEVRLISFTASREARGVHLAWQTGYEVNNLGFHLYREIDGRRTRITRSLVAGSGLMVGSRIRVTSEQSYGYWDLDARARVATGGLLARGRRLQRQEHVARTGDAGERRTVAPPPVENSPLAERPGPRRRHIAKSASPPSPEPEAGLDPLTARSADIQASEVDVVARRRTGHAR